MGCWFGGQASGGIHAQTRGGRPITDHQPGPQCAPRAVRFGGRSGRVDGGRAPPGGDHREVHDAKRERVFDIDEHSGTRRRPGGVELLAPYVGCGVQHGEVEGPLAARVGQATLVRLAGGPLSEKLTKYGHRRMLTWLPENQLDANWASAVSRGARAIGPGPIDQSPGLATW